MSMHKSETVELVQQFPKQYGMPFVEALEAYAAEKFIPFHTPGHKIGQTAPLLLKQWMQTALQYDLGVMYALDDLHEPESCLKEAQSLAAQLYGAEKTWFSVNGTTAIIETMLMGTLREGDSVIIPREAHKSVMNGVLLSGANPIYAEGVFLEAWGIQLGITVEILERTIADHPEAKAVVFVHPNYYGVGLPIQELIEVAHSHHLIVLVDEAHGAHLPFLKTAENHLNSSDAFGVDSAQEGIKYGTSPTPALEAGADLVAQSTHKLIGSLTQTSMLHGQGSQVDWRRVTQVHQMLQSTSPNYIFLASLDMARQQMATEGMQLLKNTLQLSRIARKQLNAIPGIKVLGFTDVPKGMTLDETKILINFSGIGMNGSAAERLLREYKIEVELTIADSVLVLITIGDTEASIESLVQAVAAVSGNTLMKRAARSGTEAALPIPQSAMTPRQAFMAPTEIVELSDALGRISCETISYYPPGIPFIAMGEIYTEEILQYIKNRQRSGYVPNGAADTSLTTVKVVR